MISQGSDDTNGGNDDGVRKLLDARLGEPLSEEEFRFLTLQGAVAAIQGAPEGSPAQAAALRGAAKTVKDLRIAQGRPLGEDRVEASPMATDDRMRRYALSRLLALEAERAPEVKSFRSRHLGGGVLSWESVGEWITSQARADGEPSQYVEIVLPPGASLKPTITGLLAESATPLSEVRVEGGVRAKTVGYALPGEMWVKVAPVASGGVLDELRALSERLARLYSWKADQATVFVLSGVVPYMVAIRLETEIQTEHPAASRVTMVIDPVLSPQEVLETYSALRAKVLEGTYRPLSQKHLQLAVFAAERRPPAKWAAVMRAWNLEHPELAYTKETIFARDATAAQNRLLRPRLDPDALL